MTTAAAAWVLAAGLCASGLSMLLANRRAPVLFKSTAAASTPLPDLVHGAVPSIPVWIPDVLLVAAGATCLLGGFPDSGTRVVALGVAFCCRSVLIHATVLPTPVPVAAYCHGWDLFVSGHTLAFCALSSGSPVLCAAGAASLVAARQHYTIDVVGALLLWHWCISGPVLTLCASRALTDILGPCSP